MAMQAWCAILSSCHSTSAHACAGAADRQGQWHTPVVWTDVLSATAQGGHAELGITLRLARSPAGLRASRQSVAGGNERKHSLACELTDPCTQEQALIKIPSSPAGRCSFRQQLPHLMQESLVSWVQRAGERCLLPDQEASLITEVVELVGGPGETSCDQRPALQWYA